MGGAESGALAGRYILITRAREHFSTVAKAVERRGGVPLSLPCLAVEPLSETIAEALPALDDYPDLLFTSSNGIDALLAALRARGRDPVAVLREKRIAAVGKKCAAAVQSIGVDVAIVPEVASQDGLIDAYLAHGLPEKLLFFRAEAGRDTLQHALTARGVSVRRVAAYRTLCPSDDCSSVIAKLERGEIDAVLLGSARTAAHYLKRAGSTAVANRAVLVAISEQMAAEARTLGLEIGVVAKSAAFEAMLDSLADYYQAESR